MLTRRRLLIAGAAGLVLRGCSGRRRDVTLYTSIDQPLLGPIVREFTRRHGLGVALVGDSEATKTTGLVERVIAEASRPRADVFWSSEASGCVELARRGLLAPFTPRGESAWEGPRPERRRDPLGRWHAFAPRARRIVYHTGRLAEPDVPRRLWAWLEPAWKGRLALADPRFGTTRSHLGALLMSNDEATLRAWFKGLARQGVRVLPGNSAVVRAVAQGEATLGLTDSDDIWGGIDNRWPVAGVGELPEPAPREGVLSSPGALAIPCTAGLVAGGPNPPGGEALLNFLCSPACERLLAQSPARHAPWRPEVAREFASLDLGEIVEPAPGEVASWASRALQIWREVFGG